MARKDSLHDLLENVQELETYLHALLGRLDPKQLKAGEDLSRYAKEYGLTVPAVLQGETMTWEDSSPHLGEAGDDRVQTIVLTRPGHPGALGLVIKCVRVGKWKFCLECGWIWCRIVVTRRF